MMLFLGGIIALYALYLRQKLQERPNHPPKVGPGNPISSLLYSLCHYEYSEKHHPNASCPVLSLAFILGITTLDCSCQFHQVSSGIWNTHFICHLALSTQLPTSKIFTPCGHLASLCGHHLHGLHLSTTTNIILSIYIMSHPRSENDSPAPISFCVRVSLKIICNLYIDCQPIFIFPLL